MTFIAIPVIIFFILSVVSAYAAIVLVIFFLIRRAYHRALKKYVSIRYKEQDHKPRQ